MNMFKHFIDYLRSLYNAIPKPIARNRKLNFNAISGIKTVIKPPIPPNKRHKTKTGRISLYRL